MTPLLATEISAAGYAGWITADEKQALINIGVVILLRLFAKVFEKKNERKKVIIEKDGDNY